MVWQGLEYETVTAGYLIYYKPMDYLEDSEYPDDDALQKYLDDEGLALVPIDFMRELMALMEAHIRNVCGVDREELNDIMARLEDLLGEDDMMDLSVDGVIDWVNTLKSV